jgi:hypothetical protein
LDDDFENGIGAWTHGGADDDWELGRPSYGPTRTYSGLSCWGVNLDGPYRNNSDCWLQSPFIDLTDAIDAYIEFRLWNSVEDDMGVFVYDPLWIEVVTEDSDIIPLSCHLGGVNDDPLIPQTGGWTGIVLDLNKYIGSRIRIRFHFRSDGNTVFAGPYVDNVRVHACLPDEAHSTSSQNIVLCQNVPNPFNGSTNIAYYVTKDDHVVLEVMNALGERVVTLLNTFQPAGSYSVSWRPESFSSGLYVYRLKAGEFVETRKCLFLR